MSTRLKTAGATQGLNLPGDSRDGSQSRRPAGTTAQAMLELLLASGPMSRSALAEALHVSRARLTELSRTFLEQGLLLETTEAPPPRRGKGRPFMRLELNAKYGYCLGASVTDSRIHLVLTDLGGAVHGEQTLPASDAPEQLATIVRNGLAALLKKAGVPKKLMLGIGLALSGFVDRERGVCLHSANLGWYDVPIAAMIARTTGIPTFLENDANAAAISEKLFGVAREARNFALITLGPSIGGAHYVGGRLYRGSRGGAGEIAHCTVEPDGPTCRCGKRGCLDIVASKTALMQAARQAGLGATSVGELEQLAACGDPRAARILKRGSQALGLVIAGIVQSNDPELVLIADTAGFDQGIFLTDTRHTVENNILPRFLRTTRIEVHPVQDEFWARGAASMATQQVLSQFTST